MAFFIGDQVRTIVYIADAKVSLPKGSIGIVKNIEIINGKQICVVDFSFFKEARIPAHKLERL